MRGGGDTTPISRLLIAAIAFKFNVLHHLHSDVCRMDLPGPTTSVGTRTDYSVGPWDYTACATRYLKAWSTRTTQE
jgi:hypothetical protein